MPERPKRRKNNKNKRKNKNNKPDTCKNNDDLNNSNDGETCSIQSINESVLADASESVDETKVVKEDIVVSSKDDENLTSVVNESTLIGDLNNNSDQTIGNNFTNSRIDIISDAGAVDSVIYVVEPPDQSLSTNKTKLINVKSKSLDSEDATNIVDITEDASETDNENSLALIDSQNVVVTHVDSDIEWEVADNLSDISQIQETATGTLSITTLPLAIIHSDQNKALSAEEEKSLRNYLKTINLVTQPESVNTIEIKKEFQEVINQEIKHRLRKRGSADDPFLQRMGPSRILDVIDEEGSSESSMTSRRQSYLSDKKSDIEDIDDDVFEDKNKHIKFKSLTSNNLIGKRAVGRLIPQECVLVGAKIKDPEVEARGDWTLKTVEKMTGAEIVYLTDTSSSSSSLHEIGDDDDGVETDVSVRIITPTIEVTDTENFFKKSYTRGTNDKTENETLTELPLNSNQFCNNANRSNEQVDTDKKEHIIEMEYDCDVKEIRQNGQDHCIIKENGKRVGKEYYNNSQNKNKQESNIKYQPIISTKSNEQVIKIEMNSDAIKNKSIENMFSIQSDSEIVVLSTDNIQTNLYVKDVDENKTTPDNLLNTTEKCNELTTKNQGFYDKPESVKIIHGGRKENLQNVTYKEEKNTELSHIQKELLEPTKINNEPDIRGCEYALEAKIIKCEFNDAINNLIHEVSNEFEAVNESTKDLFIRQDSSSSLGSSQCTAKYNPNCESLNDISNIVHDEITFNNKPNEIQSLSTTSHIKDVFESISESTIQKKDKSVVTNIEQPLGLKDLCVLKITTLPYGDKILEELASVSKRLHDFTTLGNASLIMSKDQDQVKTLPHCLPDTSIHDKRSRSTKSKNIIPPPVLPRHSSLKKSQCDDQRTTGTSTKTEAGYVCLSPSQKMLMDKTNTVVTEEHSRHYANLSNTIIERNEYIECDKSKKQVKNCNTSETPNVFFKSQTGSRLFALIRDPTLTRNINSLNDRINNSETKRTTTISAENNQESLSTNRNFLFKPIPPPRPKKHSTSIYESDENSDFTDNSLRSIKKNRKLFHYSTGTLDKEIENDICTIQNMHRFLTDTRGQLNDNQCPRRPSLPKDLCDQQMEYIRKKEKEVDAEIKRLEGFKNNITCGYRAGPKAPLISEREVIDERIKDNNNYCITRKRDVIMSSRDQAQDQDIKKGKISSMFNSSQEELLREKMYSEYVTQMAEREERKQHKVIKITNTLRPSNTISKSMSALDAFDTKVNNPIEKEFISKARERWDKLGIKDPETEDERDYTHSVYKEPKVIEHKIKVIESGKEKDVKKLPSHLQEFVNFTAKDKEHSGNSSAIWRPGAPPPVSGSARSPGAPPPPPPPPIWSPGSACASPHTPRKTFRPVHFEESPPTRRKFENSEQNGCTSGSESESRLRTSQSAPVTGLSTLGSTNVTSRLPRAQNPTVTLLQKAREGQLSRGAYYIQQERDAARLPRDRPSPPRGDPVHALRKEYASESEVDRSDYERGGIRKMADAQRKVEGIGPITKDGMPVALRSEVKDPSRWYKKMYDTIHKNKYDDDYVTIRYKSRRGQPPERVSSNKSQYAYFDLRSGYLSEPEGGLSRIGSSNWSDAYDSDTTGPRRRTASVQEERRFSEASTPYMPSNNKYSTLASARASQEIYKNQPGRIEDYVPGKSSVIDKESKQWWDEVMDIFDGQNISSTSLPQASPKDKKNLTTTILSKSNMARALKESGYESDSTLVFRRREDTDGPLSPAERRAAYRDLQAGGEPPLRGFRSPAPPRQENDTAPEPPRRFTYGSCSDTESPRRYVESDVNIHYRCPVRQDPLPLVPERELARQQAEHMKKLYREQKRNKYLQEIEIQPADIEAFDASMKELQDMQNRRHQDNFTPSQKNILPLNRYDEAEKVIAKAIYTFNGQTSRELSFKKGDMIHVRRQIDNNWYEGELHGRIGLFPYNYVQIQKGDVVQTPKKPVILEGRARAKFDFTAQTNLELPLKKGEIVVLTRRIDQNWWEGRNGAKAGIFPDSYVTILQEPSSSKPEPHPMQNSDKPIASPAAHGLLNGTAKRSMGAHSYTPQQNSQALSNAPPATQPLPGYVAKPAQATMSAAERGYGPPGGAGVDLNNTEPLYVDTNAEAIPYRAMYKYRPQNPDELELNEGDTVYVLEKCDDGWYVGSSQRTGRFGTFPGNYVERI